MYIYIIYNLSQAFFRRHSLHNSINTIQVESKTICFSSLTYISALLNGLHRVNGRYKHHTPLLHDNEQIWKLAGATKEDKHARALTGRET